MQSAAKQGRDVCCLALQERDAVIAKLRRSMSELSFKCEAATAQAEASHPYQQRYTDLQACATILCAMTTCSCELDSRQATTSPTIQSQSLLECSMKKNISPMLVQQAAILLIVTSAFRLLAAFVAA